MATQNHSRRQLAEPQRRLYVAAAIAAVFVIAPALLYLCAIPLGWVGATQRLGAAEATVFAAILAFTLVLILTVGAGVERLSISGKGVEFRLRRVQDQVASLRFLISHYLSDSELKYLQGLSSTEGHSAGHSFDLTGLSEGGEKEWHRNRFHEDLRHLRALGLMEMRNGTMVRSLPDRGNLSDYCEITGRGEEYLKLRHKVEREQA